MEKYKNKIAALPAFEGLPFILEGNPDDSISLTRPELNALLDKPAYKGYKVLPNRTVKIKQRQDNANFAAMVESVDESLGRVMAKLKELGIEKNTIVIFCSDNGGMSAANFGNPERIVGMQQLDKAYASSNLPLRGAKGWMYEGGLRIPMIVKWPGKKSGMVCQTPIILTDFYPTILAMTHSAKPKDKILEGENITPLLEGKKMPTRALYWHFPHYSNHGMQSPGGAIRYGDYKLVDYFERGSVQLFNLRTDVAEQKNLAASQPAKVAELKKMLSDWRTKVDAHMMKPNPDYVVPAK